MGMASSLADHAQQFRQARLPQHLRVERRRDDQQFIQQDAQRIHVGAGVDVAREEVGLLRAHVFGGADGSPSCV